MAYHIADIVFGCNIYMQCFTYEISSVAIQSLAGWACSLIRCRCSGQWALKCSSSCGPPVLILFFKFFFVNSWSKVPPLEYDTSHCMVNSANIKLKRIAVRSMSVITSHFVWVSSANLFNNQLLSVHFKGAFHTDSLILKGYQIGSIYDELVYSTKKPISSDFNHREVSY